jgi:predicted flap endonuclease-1-like 5' DNA nuclease
MWDQTFKRWIDLVFWWLPKHQAAERPAPKAAEPTAKDAQQQTAAQRTQPAAKDAQKQGAEPATKGAQKQTPARSAEPAAKDARKQAAVGASKQPDQGTRKQTGSPRAAASEPAPDDLTVIKGIGPAVQKKLHALGIKTFHDLAAADPATLTKQLKGRQPISQALVRDWTKAADRQTAARH